MIAYVTVGADDIARAKRFYAAFLPALGYGVTEGPEGLSYGLVLCFSQASMQEGSRCPAPYICRSAAAAGSCWAWSLRTVR